MANVSFRIDDDLKIEIDELAEQRGYNVSTLFRQALSQVVESLKNSPNERDNFRLTLKDRLFLINQYQIMQALYPDQSSAYQRKITALENGYSWHYKNLVEYFYDDFNQNQSKELLDILDMYEDLLYTYQNLEDKTGIDLHEILFPGFHGNTEGLYSDYAKYFCIELDRFNSLHPRIGLDSHMPVMPMYRRMLPVFLARRRSGMPPLTKADIQAILEARRWQ